MTLMEFLQSPDLCPRCYTGIDDNHDGDCATCARVPEKIAAQLRIKALMKIAATCEIEAHGRRKEF